ncbi:MAG TPA: SpoIID/LytB domain-containing protein [Solirubrobacteraceae bacterium]|nr:SpoIID/LytB domain-containing protein [Solirubrobacteraceae bacterium]
MRALVLALGAALLLAVAPAQAATKLTITGAGFGHGIGMSQYGAYGYALHLQSYSSILGHYYTGTALGQLQTNPEVKVLLQGGKKSIAFNGALNAGETSLDPATTYTVKHGGDGLVLRDNSGKAVGTTPGPLRVDAPVDQALKLMGTSVPGVRDGLYRGSLIISLLGSRLIAVNALDLEGYVRGVVSGESPSGWPPEALKAQAVAARTYAITTHAGGATFDQYADTRSQVYRGVAAETPNTDAAVAATRGQVVTYGGQPVTTYFFSTSGGETEDIENSFVGSQPQPWLKAVDDPFDSVSPKHRWGPLRYTAKQVQSKLRRYLKGTFKSIKVLQRGVSPRVVRAQVIGTRGRINVTGPQLRSAFGLNDTWAFFTSVTSKASKSKKKAKPTPAPAGDPSGGISPVARAAAAAAPRIEGTIAPARVGRWLSVERLDGRKWVTATDARVLQGGRYSVQVPRPGVYRVVYGKAVGPDVRVG